MALTIITKDKRANFNTGNDDGLGRASYLHGIIGCYIAALLEGSLDCQFYHSAAKEVGIQLDKSNTVIVDIAIFKTEDSLTFLLEKYASKTPLIAIEVDIQIETTEFDESHYVYKKTRKLLEWGTEKIIWVLVKQKS